MPDAYHQASTAVRQPQAPASSSPSRAQILAQLFGGGVSQAPQQQPLPPLGAGAGFGPGPRKGPMRFASGGWVPANAWASTPGAQMGGPSWSYNPNAFAPQPVNASMPFAQAGQSNVNWQYPTTFSNSLSPDSWNKIAQGIQSGGNVQATQPSYGGGFGLPGSDTPNYRGGGSGGSLGTAASNFATWPNPGTSLYPSNYSTPAGASTYGWVPSLAYGIYGNESSFGTNPSADAQSNPMQVRPAGYSALPSWQTANLAAQGYNYNPRYAAGQTNPASSFAYGTSLLGNLANAYGTPQQAALAYLYPAAVNTQYNPSNPASTPWSFNTVPGQNHSASEYLYGAGSGYPGAIPTMFNAATTSQFQNAVRDTGQRGGGFIAGTGGGGRYGFAKGGSVPDPMRPPQSYDLEERYPDMRPRINLPTIPDWRGQRNMYDQTPPPNWDTPSREMGQGGVDSVQALLTPDEFVMPPDVAKWIGEKGLQQMILKARNEKAGAQAQPSARDALIQGLYS
jgi:hypothetical protein